MVVCCLSQHRVTLQTDWKLTPLIQFTRPNLPNNELHQQPNHLQKNGTAENATDLSPEKSAVSDAQQFVFNTNHMANIEQSLSDEQRNATFVLQSSHQSEKTVHQSTQLSVPQTDDVTLNIHLRIPASLEKTSRITLTMCLTQDKLKVIVFLEK